VVALIKGEAGAKFPFLPGTVFLLEEEALSGEQDDAAVKVKGGIQIDFEVDNWVFAGREEREDFAPPSFGDRGVVSRRRREIGLAHRSSARIRRLLCVNGISFRPHRQRKQGKYTRK
jgi:hypothetical protein